MAYDVNKLSKLSGLKALAERVATDFTPKTDFNSLKTKVENLENTGGQPNVIESIKVNDVEQTPDASKAVNIAVPEYGLAKQTTAEEGYLSTYYLTKGGAQVGEKINIPKDFLVKSATLETATAADTPYTGAAAGDKYVDLVINSKEGADTESHVYLPVNELVDAYTGGNGIEISAANVVSAKIDAANANGLGVTVAGFKLDLASATAAGAMSATDKAKLDGLEVASDTEVTEMLNEVFGTTDAG